MGRRHKGTTVEHRFGEHIWHDPDSDCIEWMGLRDAYGYGRFFINGKYVGAHRQAYEMAHGPVPPRLCVLHHCDNRSCANPDHLWVGTQTDNIRDMDSKKRRGIRGQRTREMTT